MSIGRWSEKTEISSPQQSSVYEYQSVECAFTSPVIIESGMLVMYCMQFVMSVSVLSWCSVSRCYVYVGYCDVLEVLCVLMTCGVLMCVNVVSDLMYVIRPPPCLCSMSGRMAVKCGICGVLDAEVSVDSCIGRLCCVHEMFEFLPGAPYATCIELKYFIYLCFFGGILFVLCGTTCGCGW